MEHFRFNLNHRFFALQVNAYDSVHVVDSLYRSKYCLTSLGDPRQYRKVDPSTNSSLIVDKQPLVLHPDNHENDSANIPSTSIIDDDEHRVTILNLPEDSQPSSEVQKDTETESCQQLSTFPEKHQVNDINKFHNGSSYLCRPILSWMNGDGTINEVVYKGLIRRVLGILMQNPGMLEVMLSCFSFECEKYLCYYDVWLTTWHASHHIISCCSVLNS